MFRKTEQDNQSLNTVRRVSHRLGIIAATTLVGAFAIAAVLGGSAVISANAARVDPPSTEPPVTVEVATSTRADAYVVSRAFVGRIEAARQVALGFEESGTLAEVLVDEGATVNAGQVIATLDSRTLQAERNRLLAESDAQDARIELAALTFQRQSGLAEKSHSSQQRVDEARLMLAEMHANRAALKARLMALDVRLEKHQIIAPFDGKIGTRHLDPGARIAPSSPVLDLIETRTPRVRVGIGPAVAARMAPGQIVDVAIGSDRVSLKLLSIRADMEAATRTQDALFEIEGAGAHDYAFGDLVRITAQEEIIANGTWLPLSSLVEGTNGLWSVFYLDTTADGTFVRRESVEVLHANDARVYVTSALPDGARVVAQGPHRLGAGQRVRTSRGQ